MNTPSYILFGYAVSGITVGMLEYDMVMFILGSVSLFIGAFMVGVLESRQ